MRRAIWAILGIGAAIAWACGTSSNQGSSDDPLPAADADAGGQIEAPDAAVLPPPPPPVQTGGFTHYTTAHRLPSTVLDVTADGAGNIWVAGYDGLYLLRPGEIAFQRFGEADGLQKWNVLSVAGLGPNEVMVGYEGVFGGQEDNDPEWMLKSGGVDRVKLIGPNTLAATHLVIATPPGESSSYPNGRYKIRSVHTILPTLSGPYAGDIWFGGNHGAAMWSQRFGKILEHEHCAINGYDSAGNLILMTGDFFGLAFDGNGDVWIGGAHREARIPYATRGGQFYATFDIVLDAWPDADARNRTDDGISALAVDRGGNLWLGSPRNNLARYSPSSGTTRFYSKADGTPDKAVTALAADPDGSLWVGSYVGIGRLDTGSGSWRYYLQRTSGLANDSIRSLQIDSRSSPRKVLIGTKGGVSVYEGP